MHLPMEGMIFSMHMFFLEKNILTSFLLVFLTPNLLLNRTGCILLSIGQEEFHGEVLHTLKYVVNQSDYTVQILKNVTQYLSLAKTINVAQVFLPSDVMTDIDKLNIDLNTAADTLTEKTSENAVKIRTVFNAVYGPLNHLILPHYFRVSRQTKILILRHPISNLFSGD